MPRRVSRTKGKSQRKPWFTGGERPSGKGRKRRVQVGGASTTNKKRKHGAPKGRGKKQRDSKPRNRHWFY